MKRKFSKMPETFRQKFGWLCCCAGNVKSDSSNPLGAVDNSIKFQVKTYYTIEASRIHVGLKNTGSGIDKPA